MIVGAMFDSPPKQLPFDVRMPLHHVEPARAGDDSSVKASSRVIMGWLQRLVLISTACFNQLSCHVVCEAASYPADDSHTAPHDQPTEADGQ